MQKHLTRQKQYNNVGVKRLKPLNSTHSCPRQFGRFFMSFAGRESANISNKHNSLLSGVSISRSPEAVRYFETKDSKMTNEITTYNFNFLPVRTINVNNEPWFALTDCRVALGLAKTTKSQIRLDERGVLKTHIGVETGKKADGTPALQQVELTFINEPNLYRLIFRSNKPQAQAFADWVYNEVLPSIRKTGGYGAPAVDMKALGGMVKKCCSVAVKEELEKQALNPVLPFYKSDKALEDFVLMAISQIVNARVESELSKKLDEMRKILN